MSLDNIQRFDYNMSNELRKSALELGATKPNQVAHMRHWNQTRWRICATVTKPEGKE